MSNEVGGDILDDSIDSAKGLGARLAIGIGTIMIGGLMLTAGIILGVKRMMPRFSSAGKQAAVSFQDFHLGQAAPSTPATPPSPEVIAATPPAGTDDALSHRLRALQVARDANLLSAEEYERLRAEALE